MSVACTLGERIFLVCVFLAIGVEFGVDGHSFMFLKGAKKCHDVCPMRYQVVCALDVLDGCLRTFASTCVMRMYNCKYQKDYRIIAERACQLISDDELDRMTI
ncbi:uncharacterized protein [Drosophila kikkawai]|uniref:Kazal-like domain-containing protein n=1 Tax=Drosophila kikkawai TaxID=30033 RepID=A0A6P4I5X2_DROKI|nr:uncharacterized protein LOC108075566 [Drosophila kikkawai]